ncbi:MAG: VTT domain-containing protein [Candidatus Pacearchaeota archaeon]|nr:VTT domain-containing protein [Candidatus Pacearchaeota archaeon]
MINFKKLKFYTFLLLAFLSLIVVVYPFFRGYDVIYYKNLLEYFNIPELIYLGWIVLATATTMPISAPMVAGIIYFSFDKALLLTFVGIITGAIGVFYISKYLGKDFVKENYGIKSKTKIHLFNELMHKHSLAYVVLITCVYAFPSNLAYMIAGVTETSLLKLVIIVLIGHVGTAFAVGALVFGGLNSNITYILIGVAYLALINIIPIGLYHKEMKKLVLLIYNKKAYERFVKMEKLEKKIEKEVEKTEKKIKKEIFEDLIKK